MKNAMARNIKYNIYTQTTTSALKPQHLLSNHYIYTQSTTSTLKLQQIHSNYNQGRTFKIFVGGGGAFRSGTDFYVRI